MKRILLVGGGTGGHIYPLVSVSRELQKKALEKGLNLELMALADSNYWRSEFESQGVKFKTIFAPKLRRVEGGHINLLAFLAIPFTFIQAFWILFIFMPDMVFSKGSFASLMPSFAAWAYFIPIFVHESDSVPGTANRFAARLAKRVFISFENAAKYFPVKKTVLSGNPVRADLLDGNRDEACRRFNLDPAKKTILFLAGSQGAVFINNLVIAGLVQLIKGFHPVRSLARAKGASPEGLGEATSNGVQIIHQAGIRNFEQVKQETEKIKSEGSSGYGRDIEKNYRVFGFMNGEELRDAYASADIVISRSGSNIFEIAALGKPAIVIPYPYSARSHQKENAMEFVKFGAVVLEEENLKPHILIDQIERLLKPENYSPVGQKIKKFANIRGGEIISEAMISYVFRQQ